MPVENELNVEAKRDALAVLSSIKALAVIDQPSLSLANGLLVRIKALRRNFDEEFNPGIAEAFQHHRTLVAQKKKWTDPLDDAERLLKPKIATYLRDEDERRLAAERAAQRAKEVAEAKAVVAADKATDLIHEGRLDEAEKVVEQAAVDIEAVNASVPLIPDKPVAEGASLRTLWEWDVEDESKVPRLFLKLDEVKINGYVRNMKDQGHIDGIHIYKTTTVASRGQR
jgi:hypothetical protein